jgi:DNA-binding MarR family transcriptional regulator
MGTDSTFVPDPACQLLGERLALFVQRMRTYYREQAALAGLSVLQARVLRLLAEKPQSARELADHLDLDPSNITSIVDRLESADLLHREVQPGDRRVKLLVVTEEGQAVASVLRSRCDAGNPAIRTLDARQQVQLSMLMELMLKDLTPR